MKAKILQFLHVCRFPPLPCLCLYIILVTCMCVPDCRDSTDSFLFITSNIFHSTNVIYSLSDRYCLTQKHILETVLKYIHIQKFYWHPGRKIRTTHEFLSINWKRSVFILIPKKGNAKECSNYRTIALISHASKVR